ncbi:helix-turn-helix domain-containing protein [Flavobacterium sp. Sd200]|uniref:winged helix-turn-helix transcriptional regulator n=1 Tax=Flavobacterium sp. Sd200 TaxID=2692211 RepID=UPI0019278B6B|nr:helix-turn-helix domain-containing protein [Flavobacterium sp. Sd200]
MMEEPITFPGVNTQACSVRLNAVGDALYVIGGKWKLRIIIALSEGHRRFNELQRAIEGISAKVLSNELKDLEINGFVKRTVHTGTPVVVEYEPTAYTGSLHNVLTALAEWGMMHREKLRREG